MLRQIAVSVFGCALFAYACTVADARPRQARHTAQGLSQCLYDNTARIVCPGPAVAPTSHARVTAAYAEGEVIGRRPPGCPPRFCGCEASLYLFGKIDPYLNLAANWYRRFPRTSPAPGMAAARSGHVMVLVSHASGNEWLVHDGNSGGGYSRRHVRSIAGYRIVDPHGSRMASR